MYIPYKNVNKQNIRDYFESWKGHCNKDTAFVVVYHEKCNDGLVSACVVANYINTNFDQDKAVYIPANYGKDSFTRTFKENKVFNDFMEEHGKGSVRLIVVDFSFAPADIARTHLFQFGERQMDSLPCIFDSILILDHHITSAENFKAHYDGAPNAVFTELTENCYYLFDEKNSMSGASMAWNFFFGDTPESELIKVVEDRDLWRHVNPNTEQGYFLVNDLNFGTTKSAHSKNPFARYADNQDPAVESAEKLTQMLLSDEAFKSEIALYDKVVAYHKRAVDAIANRYFIRELTNHEKSGADKKHRVAFVNCPSQYASDVCAAIYNKHDVDYVLSFTLVQTADSPFVNISMRSKQGGANVGDICAYFGGGGHANAAGCAMNLLDFVSYFDFTEQQDIAAPYANMVNEKLIESIAETCRQNSGKYVSFGVICMMIFMLFMYTVLKA
jgi:oligoribonuclease NrnB/cAMP/cGMP phosphodiesterase (DHH superfamily)